MVTGRVIAHGATLQPFAEIPVYGRSNAKAIVQAIVDTGFTGYLTLPTHAVRVLGLQFAIEEEMTLANGEPISFDVYSAAIEWNGQLRRVRVHSSEGDPLIGMAMLRDHDLHVRAIPNGPVTIDPLA